MRSVWALLLAAFGAILLVLGLGILLYFPEGRDTQNRLIAIGVALLVSGAIMIVGGGQARRPRLAAPPANQQPTTTGFSNGLKYFLYAAIPAVVCVGVRALDQAETFKLSEGIGSIVAVLFGVPFFVAGQKTLAELGLGPILTTAAVSLIYFWIFFVPLGKYFRLLPSMSSPNENLRFQLALVGIHILFGLAFVQILKA
jgi:hypothetical protein